MDVNVVFTTQLRSALGKSEQLLTMDAGGSVQDAIDALTEKHHTAFAQLVVANDGQLLPSILLCVNDQQVDASVKLSDGDTLTLLSAISGG